MFPAVHFAITGKLIHTDAPGNGDNLPSNQYMSFPV